MPDCRCEEYKELIEKLVEWFESDEVQGCFSGMAMISLTHKHLAGPVVSKEFSNNAQEIWDKAQDVAHNRKKVI